MPVSVQPLVTRAVAVSIAATMVAAAMTASAEAPPPMGARFDADLDGDGDAETAAFYGAPDGRRGFVTLEGLATLADGERYTSPIYPAWSATAARFQAQGPEVIVLGTWAGRRRHFDVPVGQQRGVWVLAWERGRLVEKWRGSALARPFEDLRVADLDGDGVDELLVLEEGAGAGSSSSSSSSSSCGLTAYRWHGFGFGGAGRARIPCGQVRFCAAPRGACVERVGVGKARRKTMGRVRLQGRRLVAEWVE